MTDYVLKERSGRVATLTLNRPEKRNALNLALVRALGDALGEIEDDPEVGCVVLRGAGDKAFVAGADIAELKDRGAEESLAGINARLFRKIEELPVPVIAAVHGWTLGGGMELAMSCDIRIAAESARFGQPELNLGILPAAGAMHRLPALVGMGQAKDLILTGRIVGAREALSIGLVSRVVPDAELAESALEAARSVTSMAPMASKLAKRVMNALFRVRPDTGFALESAAQAVLFESPEKHERMQAFLDKQAAKKKS